MQRIGGPGARGDGLHARTIVNLAVSLDALDDAARAVNSTALLPGEDPALLPGPDRAVVHLVAAHLGAKESPA